MAGMGRDPGLLTQCRVFHSPFGPLPDEAPALCYVLQTKSSVMCFHFYVCTQPPWPLQTPAAGMGSGPWEEGCAALRRLQEALQGTTSTANAPPDCQTRGYPGAVQLPAVGVDRIFLEPLHWQQVYLA